MTSIKYLRVVTSLYSLHNLFCITLAASTNSIPVSSSLIHEGYMDTNILTSDQFVGTDFVLLVSKQLRSLSPSLSPFRLIS